MRVMVVVTISVGAILVAILGHQVSDLRAGLWELRRDASVLQPGDYVPAFLAPDLQGNWMEVGRPPPDGLQLLFLMSVDCPYSLASIPSWGGIAEGLASRGDVDVASVALSIDTAEDTRAFVNAQAMPVAVMTFPEVRYRRLFRPARTPQTLIVDHDGRVLHARVGVLESDAATDSILNLLSRWGAERVRPAPPQTWEET